MGWHILRFFLAGSFAIAALPLLTTTACDSGGGADTGLFDAKYDDGHVSKGGTTASGGSGGTVFTGGGSGGISTGGAPGGGMGGTVGGTGGILVDASSGGSGGIVSGGGTGGTLTGGTGGGTCNVMTCPTPAPPAVKCCVTPNGPCGINYNQGAGCQVAPTGDF